MTSLVREGMAVDMYGKGCFSASIEARLLHDPQELVLLKIANLCNLKNQLYLSCVTVPG